MKTLKLQVGKTYRNRKGEEVRIVKNDGIVEYSYEGSDGELYAENGKWSYVVEEHPKDLIEEVTATRHTFSIPDGVKEITIEHDDNRIIVEIVPEERKEPKPGDVMINDKNSVYIFKSDIYNGGYHKCFAWLGESGNLLFWGWCLPGRPATTEEAQSLFDALKKAGKRWNPEKLQVEDLPEMYYIREWVERYMKVGHYKHEHIALAISSHLEYREGKK